MSTKAVQLSTKLSTDDWLKPRNDRNVSSFCSVWSSWMSPSSWIPSRLCCCRWQWLFWVAGGRRRGDCTDICSSGAAAGVGSAIDEGASSSSSAYSWRWSEVRKLTQVRFIPLFSWKYDLEEHSIPVWILIDVYRYVGPRSVLFICNSSAE